MFFDNYELFVTKAMRKKYIFGVYLCMVIIWADY